MKDVDGRPFVFKFDETTTSQVKKQYDGYVTFFSKTANKVTTIYAGSLFVGHCMAADLVDHFNEFMKELNLSTNYCLGISMDGPNVNNSFYRKIIDEIMSQFNSSFVDVGTCPLHIGNNSFGKGMAVVRQCGVNIEGFFNDIYFFFKLPAARREDYKKGEEITDITSKYMMKYSSTRWLYIGKIAVRVFEQFENLNEYFLVYLPKQSGFSGKNGVGSTERYQRIKSMLQNKLSPPLMTFIVYVTTIYTPFVLLFQREEPLIHILHTQTKKLIADLLRNFLTSSFLSTFMVKNGTEMTLESLRLLDLDKIDKSHVKGKIDMGSKAKSLLNAVDPLQKKKFIESTVIPFYKSCVKYLLEELPLNCQTSSGYPAISKNSIGMSCGCCPQCF